MVRTTMAQPTSSGVVVGVDTHKDTHVARAKDALGRRVGEQLVPTTPAGYRQLLAWARGFGEVGAFGVEGTGSYGAGLARYLQSEGEVVIAGLPKGADGRVEMLRALRVARSTAVKARTQAVNALKALVVTASSDLREQLRASSTARLVHACARLRPGELVDPTAATKVALRSLATRSEALEAELERLNAVLARLVGDAAPELVARFGVGPDSAGALLVAAGDNPGRLRSEAAFAMLCGASPIEASSGKIARHRLNRGGDRQANAALYHVVMSRLRWDRPTQDYMARRTAEGRTKREVIRCLKRYVAREIYLALKGMSSDRVTTTLAHEVA